MKKYVLCIGTVVIASILLAGCTVLESPTQTWTWDLQWQAGGYANNLNFTQEQLTACNSTNPEDVFRSIDRYWMYCYEPSTSKYYWYNVNLNGGTLEEIKPNIQYNLKVTTNCTLRIEER